MDAENKNITWIASFPKSGNTWFRILISSLLSNSSVSINNLTGTILSSNRSIFDIFSGVNSSDLTINEINNIRPSVFKMISASSPDDLFIKTHEILEPNSKGESIFPKTVSKGAIYIIRNPLDIAVSLAFHSTISINKSIKSLNDIDFHLNKASTKLSHQLPQKISSWSAHIKSWVTKSEMPVHIIRYEDMLSDPFYYFKKAIRFLDLDFSNFEIQKAIERSSFEEVQKQEQLFGFDEKPITSPLFFHNGTSGKWKEHLNSNQIELITNCHSGMMEQYGYTF